ncbi:rhomboid family intramembrane serine protease [Nocardiopsis terrae]|uniref:Membrane associated rhomboid family serine protease n=1 Tax=Nocardiopsis terrae TaxID=372655 RepID=A0ABR9HNJ9_9ACTN|nr:rhomboid family intramembrane serine protease [Nocardiopsis terrae]MBE1460568.1 membrane associated rhomboid family serine protease [Nocardiopsis terrae]GHC72151.1 rhomboid family intramembrane serine protease [Nocardiopsis terrae]
MKQSRITAILTVAGMLAAMWVLEILDTPLGGRLDRQFGIRSGEADAPWAVLTAPFMHGNFAHLIGNSLPFLVLGSLVAFSGLGRFLITTLIVALVSGVGVWLFTADNTVTVGASGLVFGYFGYTVLRGIIERKTIDIVIMICVVIFYGTMIWGVLPQHPGVSWQAHLFGFLGGLLAAYVLPRREKPNQANQGIGGAQGGYYAP